MISLNRTKKLDYLYDVYYNECRISYQEKDKINGCAKDEYLINPI